MRYEAHCEAHPIPSSKGIGWGLSLKSVICFFFCYIDTFSLYFNTIETDLPLSPVRLIAQT